MIIGIKDDALRQRILQETTNRELTAEKVVEAIKIKEVSKTQMQYIKHRPTKDVNFVHKKIFKNNRNIRITKSMKKLKKSMETRNVQDVI